MFVAGDFLNWFSCIRGIISRFPIDPQGQLECGDGDGRWTPGFHPSRAIFSGAAKAVVTGYIAATLRVRRLNETAADTGGEIRKSLSLFLLGAAALDIRGRTPTRFYFDVSYQGKCEAFRGAMFVHAR